MDVTFKKQPVKAGQLRQIVSAASATVTTLAVSSVHGDTKLTPQSLQELGEKAILAAAVDMLDLPVEMPNLKPHPMSGDVAFRKDSRSVADVYESFGAACDRLRHDIFESESVPQTVGDALDLLSSKFAEAVRES